MSTEYPIILKVSVSILSWPPQCSWVFETLANKKEMSPQHVYWWCTFFVSISVGEHFLMFSYFSSLPHRSCSSRDFWLLLNYLKIIETNGTPAEYQCTIIALAISWCLRFTWKIFSRLPVLYPLVSHVWGYWMVIPSMSQVLSPLSRTKKTNFRPYQSEKSGDNHDWLVVWNSFIFPLYWVANHPNWRTHIFQRGSIQPPTRWIWVKSVTSGARLSVLSGPVRMMIRPW